MKLIVFNLNLRINSVVTTPGTTPALTISDKKYQMNKMKQVLDFPGIQYRMQLVQKAVNFEMDLNLHGTI